MSHASTTGFALVEVAEARLKLAQPNGDVILTRRLPEVRGVIKPSAN